MKMGTRTLAFGQHQVFIHPWFVLWGWIKLYGVPPLKDWLPLLVCFVVHDWGYFSLANLDGPEGEEHPRLGARIVGFFFGQEWHDFCLDHSRFLSKQYGRQYSRLCVADKQALLLTPRWLMLFLTGLSGEAQEYRDARKPGGKYYDMEGDKGSEGDIWYDSMVSYLEAWIPAHKDLCEDTWTVVRQKGGFIMAADARELELKRLDEEVDRFAAEMKEKLHKKYREGWSGWDDPQWEEVIKAKLWDHANRLVAGQPQEADVSNLSMFLRAFRRRREEKDGANSLQDIRVVAPVSELDQEEKIDDEALAGL